MISKPTGLLRAASLAAALLVWMAGCGGSTTLQSGVGGKGGAGGTGAGGAGGNAALVDAACGVGPMLLIWGDCLDPLPVAGCPTIPAGAYTSLVFITFCKFLGGTGGCSSGGGKDPSKYWLGTCPSHNALSIKRTAYVSGGPGKTIAEAKLEVAIHPAPGGAFEVTWSAQELDVATQKPLGPPFGGKHSLPSICCKVVWDIYFPKGDYTYRLKAQTDWDTSVK